MSDLGQKALPVRPLHGEGTKRLGAHNAHPHPSGVAEPSQADELITRRLKEALALVEIRVLDHCIVAGSDVVSLAELGRL